MANEQMTFKRIEKKYLITDQQYEQLIGPVLERTNPDCHKKCTIYNIYFDTPDYLLIRRSIDKPVYKEKLRLRSYGIPDDDSPVFVEIKKKYKKVVYKRRVEMNIQNALSFLKTNQIPEGYDRQILKEISWFLNLYKNISPAMLIFYDRGAYYGKENCDLRITFDTDVLWQDAATRPPIIATSRQLTDTDILRQASYTASDTGSLDNNIKNLNIPIGERITSIGERSTPGNGRDISGSEHSTPVDRRSIPNSSRNVFGNGHGTPLLSNGLRIMEIKIPGAMPLWLADLLASLKIYPTSFSKYGTAYCEKLSKGEINYA